MVIGKPPRTLQAGVLLRGNLQQVFATMTVNLWWIYSGPPIVLLYLSLCDASQNIAASLPPGGGTLAQQSNKGQTKETNKA